MRRTISISSLAAILTASAGVAHVADAAPALRVQVDQHGDFLLIGNTLGYDCAAGTPLPVVGTLAADACLQSAGDISDSSPDVYWSADDPTNGLCLADTTTPAAAARSTAVLTVPVGATITHAFLYWSAINTTGVASTTATLQRVGASGFGPTTLTAIQSWTSTDKSYQSVADVTSIVQQNGSGAYRVSDIDVAPFANVDVSVLYGGWWLVAFYQLPADPLRNLALFDGLDAVAAGANQSVTLSGFLVPNAGFDGKLGVVAFEGDNTATGDALLFNGVTLSNAENPANNFFNSTRSWLGLPVSVVGDLPQLTGTPQSMAGVDIDVVDITADLTMGQTSALITATTSAPVGDTYYMGGFVTSISTFAPDFTTSTKTGANASGSGPIITGDTIRYTITATNTGNDSSAGTVVTDPLPANVTFVPGSIKVTSGANLGTKTDAAGDDQGEYVAGTNTVVVRLGMNATATMGGTIAAGASSSFTFDAKVNAGITGMIANQATIAAGGTLGAPVVKVLTDGNGTAAGAPPTVVIVNQCTTDSDCGGPMSGIVCDPTSTCIPGCRGMGGNGCPTGMMCSSTTMAIGTCGPVATTSSSVASSSSTTSGGGTGGVSTTASSSGAGAAGTGGMGASSTGGSSAGGAGGSAVTAGPASGAGGGGFIAVGSGVACNASSGRSGDGAGWILGVALAALAGRRRRRDERV